MLALGLSEQGEQELRKERRIEGHFKIYMQLEDRGTYVLWLREGSGGELYELSDLLV